MKHTTAVFFRFLAILVIIFWGITAIIPQATTKNDEKQHPVWSDVNDETDADILFVYDKGIIMGGTDGVYGKTEPMTAGETAYAVVAMYEDKEEKDRSYSYYSEDKESEYIKKAQKYGLWKDGLPNDGMALSREQFGAVIYELVKDEEVINEAKTLPYESTYMYKDEALAVYNRGIMLDGSIVESFSPTKEITREDAVKFVMMCIDSSRRIKITMPDYTALEEMLKEKMSGWQGDWSLCFEDYTTGNRISINSHQVYSASLIKLFVAQTVYQRISDGNMAETAKVNDELRKMITYSDNDAWKYLARQLGGGSYSSGMSRVTQLAKASGFADTGTFYQGEHKNYNFTSVNDCCAFLRGVLDGIIVNKECSDKLLALLKQQQHTQKIPAGIPDTVITANKTGELDYIQGDAAIVFAPSGTYILCIIGDDLNDAYGQIDKFIDLSKIVYEYLN